MRAPVPPADLAHRPSTGWSADGPPGSIRPAGNGGGGRPPGKSARPANEIARSPVSVHMTFLKKLLGGKSEPKARVRVCVECGMPVAEHKDWCSIFRGQKELDQKAAGA